MTANLATQGTRSRSAPQIATELEVLGAALTNGAGWDSSSLGVNAPAPNFEAAAAILAEIATAPAFAAEELGRQRQQALDGLDVAMRQPGSLAGLAAPRVAYGAAPYGHPLNGSPASLKAMTPADLQAFHRAWWRPEKATLVITGQIAPEAGFALAERLFGGWRAPPLAGRAVAASKAGPPAPQRVVVVNLPDSGQAAVVATMRAVDRKDPHYYPLLVGNAVLGVGYSSRLNQEIRIKRGLSYGAGSSLSARADKGVLTVTTQTDNPSAATVVGLVRTELERLAKEPIPEAELGTRKAVLTGGFGRNLGTTEGLAELIANLVAYELPLSELERYTPNVRAVTPDQIRASVASELAVGAPSIVVVGEADAFLAQLRPLYPNIEVVQADAINLDSPSLR